MNIPIKALLTPLSMVALLLSSPSGVMAASLDDEGDILRREHAQAIINYEAEARMKEFNYELEKFYMIAPGHLNAIEKGKLIGASDFTETVESIVADSLTRNLPVKSAAGFGSKVQLFRDNVEYFAEGDPASLKGINASKLILNNKIDQGEAQSIINNLTNPFPTPLPLDAIKGLEGAYKIDDQEFLATRLATETQVSAAVTALGQIASNRILSGDAEKTNMELMEDQVNFRYSNDAWHKELAVASETALLREITLLLSLVAKQQHDLYKQNEQAILLDATLVAAQSRVSALMSQLTEALTRAASEVEDISGELRDLEFESPEGE